MTIRPDFRWLLVLPLLILSSPLSRADAPVGTLHYSFTTDEAAPIVDLSGTYQVLAPITHPDGWPQDVVVAFSVHQDGRGRLSGRDLTIIAWGDDFVAGEYVVSGQVTRSRFDTRVRMTVRISGWGVIAGQETNYRLTIQINSFAYPEDGEVFGNAKADARLLGGKAKGRTSEFFMPLPPGMDGSWDLTLNVAPGVSPLAGTGVITLSTGRILNFNLKGNYIPARDQSRLKLTGAGVNRGSNLNVTLDGFSDVIFLGGRVMGQKMF